MASARHFAVPFGSMTGKDTFQAGEPSSAPPPSQRKPPHCILVVDDDDVSRYFSTATLIRSGFEVDVAADGAAGWEVLQAKHYDLLITDNSMPKVTGIEIVEMLHTAQMDVPVILVTGLLPAHEFSRHPWLRTVDMLIKPFTSKDLLATVNKVLGASDSAPEHVASPQN
jgi:CheY-like chemotaxis protein